jgi:predicted DCC family thiol-disulfide oxidoreductase YuxK
MSNPAVIYPLTIFYDASCPLCRKEMHALKEYDEQDRLRLVDCSNDDFQDDLAQQAKISRTDMMNLIHARDASGRWIIGVDVFVYAYRAGGIEGAARLFESRSLRPLLNRVYPWVARNRMVLSKVGITDMFDRWVRWSAQRAQRRAQLCAKDICGGHK